MKKQGQDQLEVNKIEMDDEPDKVQISKDE